jgi:hypothetical protein
MSWRTAKSLATVAAVTHEMRLTSSCVAAVCLCFVWMRVAACSVLTLGEWDRR